VIASEPMAMQLRYLQTMSEMSISSSNTIVLPLPLDILSKITKNT